MHSSLPGAKSPQSHRLRLIQSNPHLSRKTRPSNWDDTFLVSLGRFGYCAWLLHCFQCCFCFTKIIAISTFIATCCWQSLVEGKINRFSFSLTLKQCSLIIYKGIKNGKLVKSFTFFLYVWYKTANLVVERVCKMWRKKGAEKGLTSKRKRSKSERQMNLPVCRFEGSPTTDQQRMNKKRASHPACWVTCSWQVEPLMTF